MIYEQADPKLEYSVLIKKFWWIDSDGDNSVVEQKIVPDGYPELIFHYKDPYKINIDGHWQSQSNQLIAGQIRKHFFLKNTGHSGMFGIKLQPWAVSSIFGLDMSMLTDKVIPLEKHHSISAINEINEGLDINTFKTVVYDWLQHSPHETPVNTAVKKIVESKGAIEISALHDSLGISERSLERHFKKHIGLSPKFYCRIIRFAHIFELVKKHDKDWSTIAYYAGYYDQPHFIRNFKEFTGEEPSVYGFNEENMANFFFKD